MKRTIIGLITLIVIAMAGNVLAEPENHKSVPVQLNVQALVTMDVTEPDAIIPGPEDYARGFVAEGYDVVADSTKPGELQGFVDRAQAIKLTMFTNAKTGATIFFHGLANSELEKSLYVQDVYLTVMRDKTYVLLNSTKPETDMAVTGGIDGAWAICNTKIDGTNDAKWIQTNAEAKKFFGVTQSTESARDWWLKLGIGSLAEYTEGSYSMDLTFIITPVV